MNITENISENNDKTPKVIKKRIETRELEYSLGLNQGDINEILALVERQLPSVIVHTPFLRNLITKKKIERLKNSDIQIFDGPNSDVADQTVEHNLLGLKKARVLDRPSQFITPLKSISYLQHNPQSKKVLTIGPRTESEIYTLLSCGFDIRNIWGLDLISYSPVVELGDMHNMTYEDNSFDLIIAGYVLAYSSEPKKAANEILRVAKPGAIISVGCEYSPHSDEWWKEYCELQNVPYVPATMFHHTDQIRELFDGHIDDVLFKHDIHPMFKDQMGNIFLIFQTPLEKQVHQNKWRQWHDRAITRWQRQIAVLSFF